MYQLHRISTQNVPHWQSSISRRRNIRRSKCCAYAWFRTNTGQDDSVTKRYNVILALKFSVKMYHLVRIIRYIIAFPLPFNLSC